MQFPRPASLSFGLRAALVAAAVLSSATAAGQPDAAGLEPCADEIQLIEAVDRLNTLRRQAAPCAPPTGGAMQKLSWQPLLRSQVCQRYCA